jgi:hypothetical protein
MFKTITSIALAGALFAGGMGSALAIGPDGEKALQVLGGIYVIEKIVEHGEDRGRSQRRYEGPVTSQEERAYRRGVLDRQRQEAARREREAYECGYYGDC